MNLSELQSVQARERQSDTLQELRPSFYRDAAAFVTELRDERARVAADAEDPFEDPAVTKLTDDIRTAEQTVEAIYDRRIGKVVKLASLAAADMQTEATGLTTEETELFETLVAAIEAHREEVLARVTEDPGSSDATSPVSEPPDDGSAPPGEGRDDSPPPAGTGVGDAHSPDTEPPREDGGGSDTLPEQSDDVRGQTDPDGDGEDPAEGDGGHTTVRITEDVGAILGVDEREYDLACEDVVTLPTENAAPLIERDAAEPIE